MNFITRTALLSLAVTFLIVPASILAQVTVKESEQLEFAQGLMTRGMYDMAILQYQKFIADYPQSPSLSDAYLSLGESYFLSQQLDQALATFNQFKKLFPNSDQLPFGLLRLGQIDIQEKKYDEAIKELTAIDTSKALKPSLLQSIDYYTGQAFSGKPDPVSALAYYEKAVEVQGASDYTSYAYREMGKIQSSKGDLTQAMDSFAKSMQLAGDDHLKGELIYRTAEVEFQSGHYPESIKGFHQVLDQYPDLAYRQDALANMLLAYFNLGQYDQLLSEYKKNAKEIKDDDVYFSVHYAAVLATIELKDYDQANTILDRILAFPALKPQERAKVFVKKADIMIRQKKYRDGLALLEAYSSDNTDNPDENFFLKAEGYFGIGEYDKAFSFYENVYLNFPDSRFSKAALLGQAHTREQTGRYKESEVLFLKYVDIQDQADLKSEALYDAVIMALKADDLNGVITSANEYIKTFPAGEQYDKVLFILADSYGKNNQPQAAIDLLQAYLAKPGGVQRPNAANFLLGFNEQILGHSDKALAAYGAVDPNKENGKFYVAALKNMAIIYLSQKNLDGARVYFDRMISQSPQNDLQLKTYIWVCNEYLKLQKLNDVLRIATQAEKYFPQKELTEIKYFKAEALRGLGQCDEAIKDYDLVISTNQKNAYTGSSHIGYGLCLESSNKLDEALAEFQKSLDENSDDYTITVHARFEMANVDQTKGDLQDALKLYLLIATIYDDEHYCSESLLRAARISERLKLKDDALKLYSEILDKYKNSPAADEAKQRIGLLK